MEGDISMTKHSENAIDIVERCQRIIRLVEQNGPHAILENEVNILSTLTQEYKPYVSPVRLVLSPEEQLEQDEELQKYAEDISEMIMQNIINNKQLKPRDNHND